MTLIETEVSHAVTSKWAKQSGGPSGDEAQNLVAMNLRGRDEGIRPELDDLASLRSASGGSTRSYIVEDCPFCAPDEPCALHQADATAIAATLSRGSNPNSNIAGRHKEDDENLVAHPLEASDGHHGRSSPRGDGADNLIAGMGVRRLMPVECERLQALPDGWTDFGVDSRRYAALGDAVTASVGEWIGRRIADAEANPRQ